MRSNYKQGQQEYSFSRCLNNENRRMVDNDSFSVLEDCNENDDQTVFTYEPQKSHGTSCDTKKYMLRTPRSGCGMEMKRAAYTANRISTHKTTLILVTIVMLFLITHIYRLSLKLYEAFMPQATTEEYFLMCNRIGRYA